MNKLSHLTVRPAEGRTFVMQLEDEEGRAIELAVSPEQLSLIADELDEILERDDAPISVEAEEIYQKPLG